MTSEQADFREDFYDDSEAKSPSRSMIISALSEEKAVGAATAMMGKAARTEILARDRPQLTILFCQGAPEGSNHLKPLAPGRAQPSPGRARCKIRHCSRLATTIEVTECHLGLACDTRLRCSAWWALA